MNRCLLSGLVILSIGLAAPLARSATVFETNFGSPGYTTGTLDGHAGWSFTNAGTHSWYVAESGTSTPKKPAVLDSHPASLTGNNLFWIAARTENLASTTNTARFAFTDTGVQEAFSVSLDIYIGPLSGSSGSSFNFLLTNGTLSAGPQIFLHNTGSQGAQVRFTSGGTGEATLAAEAWYRFEFIMTPATASAGTWSLAVHSLSPTGSIVSTVYSTDTSRGYSGVTGGFDTLRFQTVSNRGDYWIDGITISTIPEPGTYALFGTWTVLLAAIGLRRPR